MRKVCGLIVVFGTVLAAAQLHAHHAASAEFDNTKTITVQGPIFKVEMTNPHGWIHVTVKGPDGKFTKYAFQTGAPGTLMRGGVDKKVFAVGTTLILEGWPARDGSSNAFCLGIKAADGEVIYSFVGR